MSFKRRFTQLFTRSKPQATRLPNQPVAANPPPTLSVPPITPPLHSEVFIDTDNCFGALNQINRDLALLFLHHPQQLEAFIQQQIGGTLTFRYYGNPAFLIQRGFTRPLQSNPSTHRGKNSDDIQIALDVAHLPASVTSVVIVSADSDFIPVAQRCQQQQKQAIMVPLGRFKPHNYGEYDRIINPDRLIQQLQQLVEIRHNDHNPPQPALPKKPSSPPVPKSQHRLKAAQKIAVRNFLHDELRERHQLNLAETGYQLRQRFNLHDHHWYGYGSCKKLCLALLDSVKLDETGYKLLPR
ncbi:NYN domain-containing protein [Ectothiorhodospiraceae bacterium BW-2]|nr:NYN domain-containing protein [Ectothiorhodospiraceae bacterium BW-2]